MVMQIFSFLILNVRDDKIMSFKCNSMTQWVCSQCDDVSIACAPKLKNKTRRSTLTFFSCLNFLKNNIKCFVVWLNFMQMNSCLKTNKSVSSYNCRKKKSKENTEDTQKYTFKSQRNMFIVFCRQLNVCKCLKKKNREAKSSHEWNRN